jgi:hypothetical protein
LNEKFNPMKNPRQNNALLPPCREGHAGKGQAKVQALGKPQGRQGRK